mgnify:CR=1 FL=1
MHTLNPDQYIDKESKSLPDYMAKWFDGGFIFPLKSSFNQEYLLSNFELLTQTPNENLREAWELLWKHRSSSFEHPWHFLAFLMEHVTSSTMGPPYLRKQADADRHREIVEIQDAVNTLTDFFENDYDPTLVDAMLTHFATVDRFELPSSYSVGTDDNLEFFGLQGEPLPTVQLSRLLTSWIDWRILVNTVGQKEGGASGKGNFEKRLFCMRFSRFLKSQTGRPLSDVVAIFATVLYDEETSTQYVADLRR